jgi:hypothetical protein
VDTDLHDLIDPADDDRVAAALLHIRDDLLVAPDEVTAARHRRRLRTVAEPSTGRRLAIAVAIAVVGTGAALTTVVPATTPASPAGDATEVPAPPVPRVQFERPAAPAQLHLPSFTDQLPAPVPADRPGVGTHDVDGGSRDGGAAPTTPVPLPLPRAGAPVPPVAPGPAAPIGPRAPVAPPEPAPQPGPHRDGPAAEPDPRRGPTTQSTTPQQQPDDAPGADAGAQGAHDPSEATPPARESR